MEKRQPDGTHECLNAQSIDHTCETSGNVWLLDNIGRYGGPSERLIVNAELGSRRYVSSKYGRMERRCAFIIDKIINESEVIDISNSISDSDRLSESQLSACRLSLSNPVSVLTGGPGTGKTYTCKVIASNHNKAIGLSPTGKGAQRLSESTGIKCFTVHMFANIILSEGDHPMREDFSGVDLIIVDEAGMLCVETLNLLLTAIYKSQIDSRRVRIIFVGDRGQLPSVGPGKVLADLMCMLPTYSLTISRRFSDYLIGEACESAKIGEFVSGNTDTYSLIEGNRFDAIHEYMSMCRLFGTMESRIITIHRYDAWSINKDLRGKSLSPIPIVCNRNNYKAGIFNGECGIYRSDFLNFGSKAVRHNQISWSYAYASTCHKAQGGEWRGVVVMVDSARYLTKEWLTTALSRARVKLSVVVSDLDTAKRCLRGSRSTDKRVSLMPHFSGNNNSSTTSKKEIAQWVY